MLSFFTASTSTLKVTVNNASGGKFVFESVLPTMTLSQFQAKLRADHEAEVPPLDSMVLRFKGKTILSGAAAVGTKDKTLKELGFTKDTSVELLKSGAKNSVANPKMAIMGEEDPDCMLKLPCEHWISPDSLTAYIRYQCSIGVTEIRCPFTPDSNSQLCGRLFEMSELLTFAKLTDVEFEEFQISLCHNFLIASGKKQCPFCSLWCTRMEKKNPRVQCPKCIEDFCWFCTSKWMNQNTVSCGNNGCDSIDPRKKILEAAKTFKATNNVEIIGTRLCPQCDMMIMWDTQHPACKHMECPKCKTYFCMRCLRVSSGGRNGKFPDACGGYSSNCSPLAPVQTPKD